MGWEGASGWKAETFATQVRETILPSWQEMGAQELFMHCSFCAHSESAMQFTHACSEGYEPEGQERGTQRKELHFSFRGQSDF